MPLDFLCDSCLLGHKDVLCSPANTIGILNRYREPQPKKFDRDGTEIAINSRQNDTITTNEEARGTHAFPQSTKRGECIIILNNKWVVHRGTECPMRWGAIQRK